MTRRKPIAGALLALAALSLPALSLGGCITVLPKAKPVQLYRFGAATPTAVAAAPAPPSAGAARGVILAQVSLPRSAAGDGLLTVSGDQVAYIGGARWVEPAAVLFQSDVEAAFAAQARDVLLLDRGQLSVASGVLRLDVVRFETRYAAGAPPTVVVRLRAVLSRPDGRTVRVQAFDAERPADADRVSAIVAAYDGAVDDVVARVVAWTEATAPTLTPPGAAP